MRAVFLVSGKELSASARAFVLAANGLKSRGHEVLVACESECPVHVRLAGAGLDVVSLKPDASSAGNAWQLRSLLKERPVDCVFVHTDAELLIATSALRLRRGGASVVRRIPPFTSMTEGLTARLASRFGGTSLLFAASQDATAFRETAGAARSFVAPMGVDVAAHDKVPPPTRASFGIPAHARLIVCVQDGTSNGARTALRTLALLAPRHPDLRLAIVGPGRLDDVRMQGSALGVNHLVSYGGSNADELSLMNSAHIGWVAAAGDAGAFGFLDFMALGVPVLASRTPMNEHFVVDGITGMLLDTDADAALTSAAVAAFLGKDERRGAMSTAARARVAREFGVDPMIAGFEEAMTGATSHRAKLAS